MTSWKSLLVACKVWDSGKFLFIICRELDKMFSPAFTFAKLSKVQRRNAEPTLHFVATYARRLSETSEELDFDWQDVRAQVVVLQYFVIKVQSGSVQFYNVLLNHKLQTNPERDNLTSHFRSIHLRGENLKRSLRQKLIGEVSLWVYCNNQIKSEGD